MYDYSDAVPHNLTQIFLNQWLYLSATGYYDAVINFVDPTTLTNYTLSSEDAFVYMAYLFIKSTTAQATTIPTFYATKVLKPIAPSVAQMTALCDSSYRDATALATYLLSLRPKNLMCTSVQSFYDLCVQIFELGLQEWYQYSGNGDARHRTELLNMADFQYMDTVVNTSYTGQSMSEWIASRALPDPAENTPQIYGLIQAIYQAGTGLVNVSQTSFSQIQKAMIEILTLLSSYSIQVMSEINQTPIILLNWGAIRATNPRTGAEDEFYVPEDIDVVDYKMSCSNTLNFVRSKPISQNALKDVTVNTFKIYSKPEVILNFLYQDQMTVPPSAFIVTNAADMQSDFSNYAALTPVQANSLPDIYQNSLR
jgi:hypothetical protein